MAGSRVDLLTRLYKFRTEMFGGRITSVIEASVQILENKITREELREIAQNTFGDMVKAVVDIDNERLAIDADLHADLETLLLNAGSSQEKLWGINLYPDIKGEDFIEYDSLINIRPAQGNAGRGVESPEIRSSIVDVVEKWVWI